MRPVPITCLLVIAMLGSDAASASTNVALASAGGVATASANTATQALVNDGNTAAQGWVVPTTASTIKVDWGSSQSINQVTAIFANANSKTFKFQYWNGSGWVDLSPTYTSDTRTTASYTLGSSVSTVAVRLNFTSAAASVYVNELQAFAETPTGTVRFKYLAWNVQHGKMADDTTQNLNDVAQYIKNQGVSVVALNEAPFGAHGYTDYALQLRNTLQQLMVGRTWKYRWIQPDGNALLWLEPSSDPAATRGFTTVSESDPIFEYPRGETLNGVRHPSRSRLRGGMSRSSRRTSTASAGTPTATARPARRRPRNSVAGTIRMDPSASSAETSMLTRPPTSTIRMPNKRSRGSGSTTTTLECPLPSRRPITRAANTGQ